MKRLAIFIAVTLVWASAIAAVEAVQSEQDSIKPVATVMAEIRRSQGKTGDAQIDPGKVGDDQLRELGESVMEQHLGNHRLHEWMDDMMGGDGSASVDAMHRQIGYNYLHGGQGGMMPGMWGGMMAGRHPYGSWNRGRVYRGGNMHGMMGNGWGGGFVWAWVFGILFLVLLVLGIVALIRYVSRPTRSESGNSALEILKTRYARGEINKEEFEAKKKDLT